MNGYKIRGTINKDVAAHMIASGKWSAYRFDGVCYLLPFAWDAKSCYVVI